MYTVLAEVFEFAQRRRMLDEVLVDVHVQSFGREGESLIRHGFCSGHPRHGVGLGVYAPSPGAEGRQANANVSADAPFLTPGVHRLGKASRPARNRGCPSHGPRERREGAAHATQKGTWPDVKRMDSNTPSDKQKRPVGKRRGPLRLSRHASVYQEGCPWSPWVEDTACGNRLLDVTSS